MQKKAFVIGANKLSLKRAETDAMKVAKALSKHGYDIPKSINFSVLNVLECIKELQDWAKTEDDIFLFYFVGHSFLDNDGVLQLVLQTSDINDVNSCLSAPTLIDTVRKGKAKQKLLILDSCQSAAINKVIDRSAPNFFVLSAADPWEDVPEIFDGYKGINGGLLSHYFYQALDGHISEVSNNRPFLTPFDFKIWIDKLIESQDWNGAKIPTISLSGNLKNIMKIVSFEETMGVDAQNILFRLDKSLHIKQHFSPPNNKSSLKLVEKFKKVLEEKKNVLNQIEQKLTELRFRWIQKSTYKEKAIIENEILAFKNELEDTIQAIEKIHKTIFIADFPEKLYQHLQNFNFKIQKKEWDDYIDLADNVGAFVINSDAEYEDVREEYWLWEHLFLNLLETENEIFKLSPFFNRFTHSIHDLFYYFRLNINPNKYRNLDIEFSDDTELNKAVDDLSDEILKLLKTQNVIIPIYLSVTYPGYSLINDFVKKIWTPLCKLVRNKKSEDSNWLILFIVDNDLESQEYYSSSLESSLNLKTPFKFTTVEKVNEEMLDNWLEHGQDSNGVFRSHKYLTNNFIIKLSDKSKVKEYIPSCGRVEFLFEKICCDLSNDHFPLDLKKLIEHVRQS